MMKARWRSAGVAMVIIGCGGEAPSVVTPPPLHVTAKPPAPPPERARWVFANADRGIVAKLDLGDAGVLYVGQSGRRELGRDGKMTDAPTLASGDLVGVLRDPQGRFVFVSSDGATWVTKDPLGALDPLHPAPAAKHGRAAIGQAAILMVRDGKLLRSTDFGATWTPIDYSESAASPRGAGASKPFGRADQVALDSKGNGVLIHLPQRLFVTHDDGATWAPIASQGLGAHLLARDGADRIIVWGYRGQRAKLDGNALVRTTELATPMYQAPSALPSSSMLAAIGGDATSSRTILTGERFVEFTISGQGKGRAVTVGSAPLGAKIERRVPSGDLAGEEGLSPHIAGWGSDIVYLRADDDADATAPTTTVFRSSDYGATWQKDGVLSGVEPAESEGVDVAAGPRGWAYVASLCAKGETSGSSCNRRQIRPAGAKGFEDLAFVEEFEPLRFAFDEAHGKVYAIGLHEGRKFVYASPLGQNRFARTRLLDVAPYVATSLGVDGKGVVHVFAYDGSHDAWALTRGDDQAKEAPTPSYLALPRGTIELAGTRGVLFASLGEAYETADAGETWTHVASNGGPRNLACTEAGCVNGDAQRVGWDLPAIHGDVVAAQAEPPHKDAPNPPPHAATTQIACTVSGAGSALTSIPSGELVDGVGPDRWAGVTSKGDGTFAVVVATKNAVRTRPLLGAFPTQPHGAPIEWRTGERVLDDGVVVARYKFTPRSVTGTYNPVDVDLAWWSARTGQTHHHLLEKVKPFRVSRFGFSGTPEIVDGGFLFQGEPSDPLYFVRDDDKVERLTLPEMLLDRETERIGKRWIIADGYVGIVHLTESDDSGKTWKQTAWSLDTTGTIGLSRVGDRAEVTLGTSSAPSLLFDVDPALPQDPPSPTVIDPALGAVCDAHAGRHRFSSYIPTSDRSLEVQIENGKGAEKWTQSFLAQTRITHDAPGGKMCVSAYTMHGADTHGGHYDYQTVYVYPEANGAWSGWRIRRADARGVGYVAEPLTCKAPK